MHFAQRQTEIAGVFNDKMRPQILEMDLPAVETIEMYSIRKIKKKVSRFPMALTGKMSLFPSLKRICNPLLCKIGICNPLRNDGDDGDDGESGTTKSFVKQFYLSLK